MFHKLNQMDQGFQCKTGYSENSRGKNGECTSTYRQFSEVYIGS